MSNAALPLEPEGPDFVVGSRLTDSDREIIGEWLDSGAFEDSLLQVAMDELEAQRLELEHRLESRDEARLPSTE
ncbi:MAG: hypothetical protein OXI18_13785 [bacterium]|nr:hypothetical protein [bacterium]